MKKKKNWLVEIDIEKEKKIQTQYIVQSGEERSVKKALNLTWETTKKGCVNPGKIMLRKLQTN